MFGAFVTLFLAASIAHAHPQAYGGNLAEVLTQNGYTKLVELVVAAGLADTVSNEGPFTVFAPTNAAIAALDPTLVQSLLDDTEKLRSVLLYHVVPGQVFSKDLSNNQIVNTAQGSSVKINIFKYHYTPVVKVNGVRVVQADLVARNGVIHGIEKVLIPPQPNPRPHHYSHRG
ncbi:uncharacterized protein sll1735-like isoform X2 [Panulirus ornatus]|uniref:uncharacterized protein sll1735-like isoform X2 n=1 Tax=Panulirus ornatus TaxID=150431 RepID=UPI003A851606